MQTFNEFYKRANLTEELATLTVDPKQFPNVGPLPKKIGGLFLKKGYRDGTRSDDVVKASPKNISAGCIPPEIGVGTLRSPNVDGVRCIPVSSTTDNV